MKSSVLLYAPSRRRDYHERDYPPPYYPPPYYYGPYPPVNPYEAAYQAHEAEKVARWIWMLVTVLVLVIVVGAIGFAVFLQSL